MDSAKYRRWINSDDSGIDDWAVQFPCEAEKQVGEQIGLCRNVRRDSMKAISELAKDGLGEDEAKAYETSVQESTDDAVKQIEGLLKAKQDELTKV